MQKFDREALSFRNCATAIVVDSFNNYLLTQTVYYNEGEWRFPGGEIKNGEEAGAALMRELEGQLGTRNFEIVGEGNSQNQYEWPDRVILRHFEKSGEWWRGQRQTHFVVKFKGKKSDLKTNPDEIREIKWVTYDELPEHLIFPNQWLVVKKVIDEVMGEEGTG